MLEEYLSFAEYVRRYGLQRSEGVLLRYLSQLYKTLSQNVPDAAKTEAVHDAVGYFRTLIERTDTSLIEEWEGLLHPELRFQGIRDRRVAHRLLVADELLRDLQAFTSRIRAEMHHLVRALARRDWTEAAGCVRPPSAAAEAWSPDSFEQALAPYFAEYPVLVFDHRARLADKTRIVRTGEHSWEVVQVLVDPDEHNLWCIAATVDLGDLEQLDGPLIRVQRIGT
jgi:hypothetical protein